MLKIKEVIKLMLEDEFVAEDILTEKGIVKLLSWQEEATRKELGEWLEFELFYTPKGGGVRKMRQAIKTLKQGKMPGGEL
uniref:Uncharacterized protein n=1 Tax=viral metagenome TaxID=1070528 RepID=A0A6M3IIA3_9ZZZZ